MKSISRPSRLAKSMCVLLLAVVATGSPNAAAEDTATKPAIGDVNLDGCVDDTDLLEIELWLGEPVSPDHPILSRLDLDDNGRIDGNDIDVCLVNYKQCE